MTVTVISFSKAAAAAAKKKADLLAKQRAAAKAAAAAAKKKADAAAAAKKAAEAVAAAAKKKAQEAAAAKVAAAAAAKKAAAEAAAKKAKAEAAAKAAAQKAEGRPFSASHSGGNFLTTHGGWAFFKVPTDKTDDASLKAACQGVGLVLPCAGPNGCSYNGGGCTVTSEVGCGNPMSTTSRAMCSGKYPSQCSALDKVYTFMGFKWAGKTAGCE